MRRKLVLLVILTLVIVCILSVSFEVQRVEAGVTIYIRADGSIEGTTDIMTVDNVTYTFTDNIFNQSIIVERNNTVVDGAGYTVEGTGSGTGIGLSCGNNVTLKNVEVTNFTNGIVLGPSSNNVLAGNTASNNTVGIALSSSSNNVFTDNTALNNNFGINLGSSSNNNTLTGNTVSNNTYGIYLSSSSNNTFAGNTASNNTHGITLSSSSNNVLTGNTVSNNTVGINLDDSSGNVFFHNNLINNGYQAYVDTGYVNTWDDGYPSGGNYWSDYTDVDQYSGPYQNETGSDGIWDHPYIIDEYNQDNYPIVPEFPSLLILPLFMIATLLAVIVYRRKQF